MQQTNSGTFPSHLQDPSTKNRDWRLKYVKAAYQYFSNSDDENYYNGRDKYRKMRDYANGKQSVDTYKEQLGIKAKGKKKQTFRNLDYTILPIAPRIKRVVVNKILSRERDLQLKAVDPSAVDSERQYISKLKSYMYNQKIMQDITEKTGIEFENPLPEGLPEPESNDDVQIHMQLKPKERHIIEMHDVLEAVDWVNDAEQIRREVVGDLYEIGKAATKVYIDENGFLKKRRCIPENLIVGEHHFPDARDAEFVGEIFYMTISELRELAGNQLSEDQLEQIEGQHTSKNPMDVQVNMYNDDSSRRNHRKIPVLCMDWKSTDSYVYHIKRTNNGRTLINQKDLNWYKSDIDPDQYERETGNKVKKVDLQNVYTAMWVVGTDVMFNDGLMTDMQRESSNLSETKLGFSFYELDSSLVADILPNLDNIQLNWLQYQNHVLHSPPKGAGAIDKDALIEFTLDGETKMNPEDNLLLYLERGTVFYSGGSASGRGYDGYGRSPVQELPSGVSEGAQQHINFIIQNIDMIREVTGINKAIDATTPDPEAGKATTEYAIAAANNALGDLNYGDKKIYEQTKKREANLIPEVVKRGGLENLSHALGSNSVRWWEDNTEITHHEYMIWVEDAMSDGDRQYFESILQQEVANGTIESDDILEIRRENNLLRAAHMLRLKKKKRAQEAMQQQQQTYQMELQKNQQSAQATEQAKQQTIQLEKEYEMELEKLKGQNELRTKKLEYKLKALENARAHGYELEMQDEEHEDELEQIKLEKKLEPKQDKEKKTTKS